eukprot:15477715-Alexandrium_andersonii.AAC.1
MIGPWRHVLSKRQEIAPTDARTACACEDGESQTRTHRQQAQTHGRRRGPGDDGLRGCGGSHEGQETD